MTKITFKQFANKNHVRIASATLIDARPDDFMSDMPEGSAHWKIIVRKGDRRMTVYYSQGPAIVSEPKIEDVLQSLQLDASAIGEPFESWAHDMGMDPDSRKAEAIYKACEKTAADLNRVLNGCYYDLMRCEEE